MTDLNSQWKKGELPSGWYWVEGCRDKEIYAYTSEYLNHMYRPKNSDRIIEQVPSYDEWKEKNNALTALLAEYGKLTKELQDEKEKHMTRISLRSPADEMVIEKQVWESTLNRSMLLQAENAQLKELLKRAETQIIAYKNNDTLPERAFYEKEVEELLGKIDEVLK